MDIEPNRRPRGEFKWYDSLWLGDYFAALDILRRVAPHRIEAFEQAMRVFRCPPDFSVKVAHGLFDGDQLGEMRELVRSIPKGKFEMQELDTFGRFVIHNWPAFTALQHSLVDLVSELAGEMVEPTYNFLSLYTHKGVCEPHLDAPRAKWTLDICIDQSDPWPIHFSRVVDWPGQDLELGDDWRDHIKDNPTLKFRAESLSPGDALLFSGPNQWHYRDPYAQAGVKPRCDLLFFHFVPSGTRELVEPANWARIFEVPELEVLRRETQYRIFLKP
jgi:hypothetical protein